MKYATVHLVSELQSWRHQMFDATGSCHSPCLRLVAVILSREPHWTNKNKTTMKYALMLSVFLVKVFFLNNKSLRSWLNCCKQKTWDFFSINMQTNIHTGEANIYTSICSCNTRFCKRWWSSHVGHFGCSIQSWVVGFALALLFPRQGHCAGFLADYLKQ